MTAAPAGHAFGVDLDADFPFLGLDGTHLGSSRTTMELTPRRALLDGWPRGSARISRGRAPSGRVVASWDHHPEAGFLLRSVGHGGFVVSPSGDHAAVAPARVATWQWQRYLVGQVLPLVSLLHGHEVFHASVVGGNSGAIALMGPSGAGKSSLAAALVERGARYVADDVLAVHPDDVDRALPGPALTSLRTDAIDRLGPATLDALGHIVARDDHEARLLVDLVESAPRLRALYLLTRDPAASGTHLRQLQPVDPRTLLGATYNPVVNDPARLVRQLDVCASLAASVAVHEVTIGGDAALRDSAGLIAASAGLA